MFRLGEVVAYDLGEEGAGEGLGAGADLRYAHVVSSDQESADDDDSPLPTPTLTLAKSNAAGHNHNKPSPNPGQANSDLGVRRLVIKGQGGRSIALLSTSVYSFKAGREGREGRGVAVVGGGATSSAGGSDGVGGTGGRTLTLTPPKAQPDPNALLGTSPRATRPTPTDPRNPLSSADVLAALHRYTLTLYTLTLTLTLSHAQM